MTMEAEFQSHLGDVLPLILDGLSDEVRERGRQHCSMGVRGKGVGETVIADPGRGDRGG